MAYDQVITKQQTISEALLSNKSDIDYSRIFHYVLIAVIVLLILILNYCSLSKHMASNSQSITDYTIPEEYVERNREPVVAGLFYPADKFLLDRQLDSYLSHSRPLDQFPVQPKILIVPHAGYDYSAAVAAKAYLTLKPFAPKIRNVILVGPSHQVAFRGAALSDAATFATPLGRITVNQEISHKLATIPGFRFFDKAHAKEHALEVQLPFLQKVLPSFKIVPLIYGDISPENLAAALRPYLLAPDTLLIFSADLSHYYDYATAGKIDNRTAEQIKNKEAGLSGHQSCGATGINAALILAKELKLTPEMLDLLNSGDVMGRLDSVVGYGAWSFSPGETDTEKGDSIAGDKKSLEDFARMYGAELMKIAKISLEEAVLYDREYSPARGDYDNTLFNKGASFVTLIQNGKLRGCIGTVVRHQSIAGDVAANTYAAAMDDKRFSPLSPKELSKIDVTISLLTGYERIRYRDEEDLLKQIQAGTDGIVLRSGDRQALFLPSVWKELPDKREFLNNLKLKAGMTPSYWSDKIKVYRFYTVEIKENAD